MRAPYRVPGHMIVVLFSALAFAQSSSSASANPSDTPNRAAVLEEYCARAADLSPLDASAHFELGLWCRQKGLEREAAMSFDRTISIDPDHAGARAALGYERYGTGWRVAGARKAARREPSEVGDTPSPETSKSATSSQAERVTAPPTPFGPIDVPPPGTPAEGAVEKKKQWAEAAFETLQTKYKTFEDDDFLIHTTHPSVRQDEVKELIVTLRLLKQELGKFLGIRSRRAVFWPEKLQFVLLRYEQEYQRFAEAIDDIDYARNPEGAYRQGDHLVLWKPATETIARWLGETALEAFQGSDRWVGWWLREGIAEMLVAKTPEGTADDHYKQRFLLAADHIKDEGDDLKVFYLLETEKYRERERERSRALALTLVDFLVRANTKGFHRLINTLKGSDAPTVPSEDSDEAFREFFRAYVNFQARAIADIFRTELSEIDEQWKMYVAARAKTLRQAE